MNRRMSRVSSANDVAVTGLAGYLAKMVESLIDTASPRGKIAVLAIGIGAGIVAELVAALLAFISAGFGHGDYVIARLLFPMPLLLMPLDGAIGAMILSAGAIQFPLYGAVASWCIKQRSYGVLAALALLHLVATIACFMGALSQFL